jgi:hypothetical protein
LGGNEMENVAVVRGMLIQTFVITQYYIVANTGKCVKRDAYVRDGVVHHAGNEAAWWRDMSIDALEIARALAGKPPKISVSRGVELSGNRRHSRDLPQP